MKRHTDAIISVLIIAMSLLVTGNIYSYVFSPTLAKAHLSLWMVAAFYVLLIVLISWALRGFEKRNKLLRRFLQGAIGEERVASALKKLPPDYAVMHDVEVPGERVTIDHVVVGPTGIFALETKAINGRLHCKGQDWYALAPGGVWRPTLQNPTRQIRRYATLMGMHLRQDHPSIFVEPVVVLTRSNGNTTVDEPAVPIVDLDHLPFFITKGGRRLAKSEAEALAARLGKHSALEREAAA